MANSKGRRKLRRQLQEAGLGHLLTPPLASQSGTLQVVHANAGDSRRRFSLLSVLRKMPFWAWLVVIALTTGITLLEGFPWLSVEEGARLDDRNPYSTLFSLTNEGYFPVTNLSVVCELTFVDNRYSDFHERSIRDGFAEKLNHSDKATIPCFDSVAIDQNTSFRSVGDLTATVAFSVYPFYSNRFRRHRTFRFRAVPGPDGRMHWTYSN